MASRGLPSDDEQLSRVSEFPICTEQPLWILFPTYLRKLHLSLDVRYVSNFTLKYNKAISATKKCSVQLLSTTVTSKYWAENDVMHESRLTPHPPCKMTFPCTDQ